MGVIHHEAVADSVVSEGSVCVFGKVQFFKPFLESWEIFDRQNDDQSFYEAPFKFFLADKAIFSTYASEHCSSNL